METNVTKLVLVVSLVAFGFHFIWESLQCIPLFIHRESPERGFLLTMARASLGDVVLTWIGYIVVAIFTGNGGWLYRRKWDRVVLIPLSITAMVLSVGFELFALQTDRWAYTDINPLVPGLGVSIVPML